MSNTTPLDTLIELAREARDQAGQHLANERSTEQQAHQQLESLQRYRQEYACYLNDAMRQGVATATLHNTQRFLASLDTALCKARDGIEAQRHKVERCQQHWQQEQRRLKAYDTLASRRAGEQAYHLSRREQRTLDDLINGRRQRENALPNGL
ncbi:flagellar export protein FliJ [Halomonas binhaiensis]|uniref:Flagellar FliJ protein n=1 Tax=Halomonas binhaiensis TaxID=2562282 RepID=A0A5C1NMZ3_9GAMM|nr:flagellar export protein FliJ [Halomonas binhaiensis]QEM83827.1 flagellar export protein FliJ [Halomonas binhaiensis]